MCMCTVACTCRIHTCIACTCACRIHVHCTCKLYCELLYTMYIHVIMVCVHVFDVTCISKKCSRADAAVMQIVRDCILDCKKHRCDILYRY